MDSYELDYRHPPLLPWELRDFNGPPVVGYDPEKHEGLFSRRPFPMVPVILVGPEGDKLYEWGVVDTGSDHTNVPLELMAELGVELNKCEMEDAMFDGAVAPYPRYMEGVEMRVAGSWKITVRPHFLPAFRFVLLGREDFAAAFKMTFDERGRKLLLEAYDDVERIIDPNEAAWAKQRAALAEQAA